MNARSQKAIPSIEKHLRYSGLCSDAAIKAAMDEQKELTVQGRFLPLGQILVNNERISQPELDEIAQSIELQAMAAVELFQDPLPIRIKPTLSQM